MWSKSILFAATSSPTLKLMPVPVKVELTKGKFRLSDSFTMAVTGAANERLYKYSTRALRRLSNRTGLFFSQDFITKKTKSDNVDMVINFKRKGKVALNEDESYQLIITPEKIELYSETDIGAFRGVETFLQLLEADEHGYYFPAVKIEDRPRFPWRGLLIDACRHWMPVEVIKRNLDGMAAAKLNVMHWHLTEDQGFRVECKTFPKLHELGSDGFYYTQEQIKEIIKYADERGIRVMPEFDMPGHATSWFIGYPELASAPGPYEIECRWGIKDPTMNPAREETYEFLDKFLAEMSKLFPDDYFHIGGDENTGKQWDANPEIQAFMKANDIPDNHQLQAYFNKRILAILTKYGKKMVGWDEIFQPGLPASIVIQSWRGQKALIDAAKKGYQAILSNGYYIDMIHPTDMHYLNDPIPEDAPLTEKEKKFILGGEATMWAELVTPENVESRIWPRTAAIAERFWSPASIKDIDDMYRRLEVMSFRLEEFGLTHEKNYDMMLRRLTNGGDISALKTLVDVFEPIKVYSRHFQGKTFTSYSPYTRAVDAARPDAKVAREFRNLVDEYLVKKTKENAEKIKLWFWHWKQNHEDLMETIKGSPILKEIEPASENLATVSKIGLEAMDYIESGKTASTLWVSDKMAVLEAVKKPVAELELMIIPAVEKLVQAAGKQG
jgi:hexosaminidase